MQVAAPPTLLVAAPRAPFPSAGPLPLAGSTIRRTPFAGGEVLRLRHDAAAPWRVELRAPRLMLLHLRPGPREGRLVLDGEGAAWSADGVAATHLLTPGSSLAGWLGGPSEGIALLLDAPAPAGLRSALGIHDPLLAHLLGSLETEQAAPVLHAIGRAVLARLTARQPEAARSPAGLQVWRLRRVRVFVEERLHQPVTLADMAAAAGLSPFHFARGFARAAGMTPFAYLRRRRCARARLLLSTTALPLAEVATRCGFRSQSHFTSVFQQAEGLPPGRWRARAATDGAVSEMESGAAVPAGATG
jgi:AraC-like DNA-binding protein